MCKLASVLSVFFGRVLCVEKRDRSRGIGLLVPSLACVLVMIFFAVALESSQVWPYFCLQL